MLSNVSFNDGNYLTFVYGADGNRVKKFDSKTGVVTYYIYGKALY